MRELPPFDALWQRAVERHGEEALRRKLPHPHSQRQLRAEPDHRYLAWMTRRIFQSGFVWRVIDNKWNGFELAFHGFDPARLAALSDADLERLAGDRRIVRNLGKITAVRENALFVLDVAAEHGSFGRFVADWPTSDIVGLWELLKRRGARLGGDSGPRFLRAAGKDTFILAEDVVGALQRDGVVTRKPTAKRDLVAVQAAFNRWHEESELPLCQISRVLSCGHGAVYDD